MPQDPFVSTADSLIAPARSAYAITPSDSVDIDNATRAIYVGTGGNLRLRAVGSDAEVTLRNVPSGTVLAIRVAAVRITGTTASDLVGLA